MLIVQKPVVDNHRLVIVTVIVTVIATGFDKNTKNQEYPVNEPVIKKTVVETPAPVVKKEEEIPVLDEDDDDSGYDEYALPPFLQNRNY